MSAPANTVTTLNTVGVREDLEDVIYRVAPEDVPFTSNIGTAKANQTLHEWQTETLAAADPTNAALEGGTFTIAAGNSSVRVGNYCQIISKPFGVSRTDELVKKAGRTSELNRQKLLKGMEGKRDFEARIIGNYASNAESGGTPRHVGGALAWIVTNTANGSGGSNGGFATGTVSAATNGTLRSFSETQVKAVMAAAFSAGGKPTQAYMGPTTKQEFSAFTGIANIRAPEIKGKEMATIVGGADVYVSDFGPLTLIPHAYGLSRDCLIIDPKLWAVAPLDGWKSTELAQTSDSTQYALTYEATLVARNEKASGAVRDIQ